MTDKTATEMLRRTDDSMKRRHIFEDMAEHFFRNWSPEDPYDKMQFSRDLMMLQRQIYADAQEPLLQYITKTMSDVVATMPLIMTPKEKP